MNPNPTTPKTIRAELDRLIIENQSEDGSIDISDQRAMRDEIIALFTRIIEECKPEDLCMDCNGVNEFKRNLEARRG